MTPAQEKLDAGERERIATATKLRADLKEFGLEHAVRRMTVPERGEARRLIRDALADLIEKAENELTARNMPLGEA